MTIAPRPVATAVAAALLGAVTAVLAAPAAPFEDTMAQRVLACTGCHGREGRAAPDGYYPRIAGKPAGYLANQLLNFRDGRRPYALMSSLLAPLSDAYLREIAGHFAALDLPYPPPVQAGLAVSAEKIAARLVNEGDASRKLPACTTCHGEALTGTAPFVPGLVGLPRDYLNAQLGAWRTGKRVAQSPDCMAEVARSLAADEIATLSSWLAAQPVPVNAKPAATFRAPVPMQCGGVETTTPKAP